MKALAWPARGDIWIAHLEPRQGADVGKQRPVLILQSDLLNSLSHPTAVIIPLSSQEQLENRLRYRIVNECLKRGFAFALIDQIRAVSVTLRLKKRIGEVAPAELLGIGLRVAETLDLPLKPPWRLRKRVR